MSKASKQFEKYLFSQHHLVALDLLNRDLELLDVLVKKGSHGFLRDRGPTIVKIGSILSLQSEDHNPAWEEWANHANDSLKCLRQNLQLETDDLFSTGSNGDYECNTEFTSSVLLSLFNFVGIGGNSTKSWSWSALNATYEKFTDDLAADLFYGFQCLWKPNLERIKLEQPSMRDGALELWVVKEIKYAKKIKVSASSEYRAHGRVDLAAATGIPIPLPGGTSQVEAKMSKGKDGATVEVTGEKVPFAFKAIRLVYKDGELVAKYSGMGVRRPRFMMKVVPSNFFNADKDPIYHMGGLLEGEDEEEGFQFLDVVTNAGASGSHAQAQ